MYYTFTDPTCFSYVISKCFREAQQTGEGYLHGQLKTPEKPVFRSQRMFKTPRGASRLIKATEGDPRGPGVARII